MYSSRSVAMPFTPFHWGPGLLLGLLLLSYLDLPTFLVASVIIDIEPLLVLTLNLPYPPHGYLHTFLGGTIVAFLLALAMSRIRRTLSPSMSFFRLERRTSFKSIVLASLFGIYLHIILDSPLYLDIRPFYPVESNPLQAHGMFIGFNVYAFCVICFIGAAIAYAAKLASMTRT